MPDAYDHFELRLKVCGPVAADSPFDSGTLWGRILCALKSGPPEEQELADAWLDELRRKRQDSPPLIVSEGFPCDLAGEPWLPLPLDVACEMQSSVSPERRKAYKAIENLPFKTFVRLCAEPVVNPEDLLREWTESRERRPSTVPALQTRVGMDRLSGAARKGQLYTAAVSVYSSVPESDPEVLNAPLPQIVFYLKLRRQDGADIAAPVREALERIALEGWGNGKNQGLGRIRLVRNLAPWTPPPAPGNVTGFVSLSHFAPAAADPVKGRWKLQPKHPVPAPLLDGRRRVALGEEGKWRVKSFLRLRAGSCLFREGERLKEFYGRTLDTLLDPPFDQDDEKLPDLYHYALSYPWPLCRRIDD